MQKQKKGQPWHQDEYYIPTRDRSLTGVWTAVEDATIENGCLWAIPKSHQKGTIFPTIKHNDPSFVYIFVFVCFFFVFDIVIQKFYRLCVCV